MNVMPDISELHAIWNRKDNRIIFFLFLCVGMMLATVFYYMVHPVFSSDRMQLHLQIIEGTAPSPYRYRLLIPVIAHGIYWLFRQIPFLSNPQAFDLAYWSLEALMMSATLIGVYGLLRLWYQRLTALFGALFAALTIPMTFINQYYQPWSYAEVLLLILMVFAAKRKSNLAAAFIVLFASFNRETGFLTVIVYFLINFDLSEFFAGIRGKKLLVDWKHIGWTAIYALIWLGVFLGLRFWRGSAQAVISIADIIQSNFSGFALWKALLNWLLFYNLFWLWAAKGYRYAAKEVRQLTIILPVYFVLIGIWAVWIEVRLLMPLFIVILPLGCAYIEKKILPELAGFSIHE